MAPRTPRGPLTSFPQSPRGSSSFTGFSSPGPAVSPENLICSRDPKARHGPRLSVQSFSLASELQTRGSSHLPDLVTWGLTGPQKVVAEADNHSQSLLLPQQLCPPGLTQQVTGPSPGGPWFLPLSLPPPSLWPQPLLTTCQPPWSSCQVATAAPSVSLGLLHPPPMVQPPILPLQLERCFSRVRS